jgi:Flp pilus assembly protein TadD
MKLRVVVLALFVGTVAWAGPQGQPSDAKAHFDRGTALYDKGDLDGAIAEYREAIRLRPDYAEAHVYLGNALDDTGDHDSAIAEYR